MRYVYPRSQRSDGPLGTADVGITTARDGGINGVQAVSNDEHPKGLSEEVVNLAKDILDDIELTRISEDKILLKAIRLARLSNASDEIQGWLQRELNGYNLRDSFDGHWAQRVGRYNPANPDVSANAPLAQIAAAIGSSEQQLRQLEIPQASHNYANVAVFHIERKINAVALHIAQLKGIVSKIIGAIHGFASHVYGEKVFSGLSETIFERYKARVDSLLAQKAGRVLEKIPLVSERLVAGDPEAISQGLTTCRRLIDAFADAVYPASDVPVTIGKDEVEVTIDKTKNRINAYIASKTESYSRRRRLRQSLSNIYDQLSKGVHNEIDPDEAYSLLLGTYVLLGEIITL